MYGVGFRFQGLSLGVRVDNFMCGVWGLGFESGVQGGQSDVQIEPERRHLCTVWGVGCRVLGCGGEGWQVDV